MSFSYQGIYRYIEKKYFSHNNATFKQIDCVCVCACLSVCLSCLNETLFLLHRVTCIYGRAIPGSIERPLVAAVARQGDVTDTLAL